MPRLTDDGQTVTLDLHGATVADAEAMIRRAARLAADRGRSRLTVIHGTSTSSRLDRNRTIKHVLYDLLDAGALPDVTSDFRGDGSTALGLDAGRPNPQRLTLADVW